MGIEDLLKSALVLKSLHSLNNLAAFKKENCGYCRNTIFHGEVHIITNVDFANFCIAFVVVCQFFDDWTQSFARSSAVGIKIYHYGLVRFEHIGFKCFY